MFHFLQGFIAAESRRLQAGGGISNICPRARHRFPKTVSTRRRKIRCSPRLSGELIEPCKSILHPVCLFRKKERKLTCQILIPEKLWGKLTCNRLACFERGLEKKFMRV
jgi:hypothetical protein